jgi:protein-L-isoaspartate(D-aspartate) O-methyltransferase
MAAMPRKDFLPPDVRAQADRDAPLPIGCGATNSQPWTVQFMLELLHVEAGNKVLDVGSGSGWTTALLAHLTGHTGAVVGVELVPELVAMGRSNMPSALTWAHIEQADPHVLGIPSGEPYDRILVSADAGMIPVELEDQLAVGGRMVVPADGVMWVVDRDRHDFHREPVFGYRFGFVPLIHTPLVQDQQPGSRAAK